MCSQNVFKKRGSDGGLFFLRRITAKAVLIHGNTGAERESASETCAGE